MGDTKLIQIHSVFNFQSRDFLPVTCKESAVALCAWKKWFSPEPGLQESKVEEVSLLDCTAYSHLSYHYVPPIFCSYQCGCAQTIYFADSYRKKRKTDNRQDITVPRRCSQQWKVSCIQRTQGDRSNPRADTLAKTSLFLECFLFQK